MNWDTETNAQKINEALARLMGWTDITIVRKDGRQYGFPPYPHEGIHLDIPNIFGSNHDAIDAIERMKALGWNYDICGRTESTLQHQVMFYTTTSPFFVGEDTIEKPSLSEAIARAMGKALESEAK